MFSVKPADFSGALAVDLPGFVWLLVPLAQTGRIAGATGGQLGMLDALQFYRQQLERQRDARLDSWRWWLPAIPGILLLSRRACHRGDSRRRGWRSAGLCC